MADTAGLVKEDVRTETQQLVEDNRANGWHDLTAEHRGIAIAFVSCGYSIANTADELGITSARVRKAIHNPLVQAFVAELQKDDYICDMISRQFITSSLISLIPKLAGEEDVPIVLRDGSQIYAKKFFPGELRATLQALSESTDFKREVDKSGKGNVNVQINFGDVLSEQPSITVEEQDDGS